MSEFEHAGYLPVAPAAFEFSRVLELGLGALPVSETLRFVEPESGEIVVLHADMTPQIARMITTRLAAKSPPFRLAYEARVLRRRGVRARTDRQIPQVGVELGGLPSPEGDLEVVALLGRALSSVGLHDFVLELGSAEVTGALVDAISPDRRNDVIQALELKDVAKLFDLADLPAACLATRRLAEICELADQPGGAARTRAILKSANADEAFSRIDSLRVAIEQAGAAPKVGVDLAQAKGFDYYTGPVFHVYAPGVGRAIASGGRYDTLLGRYGHEMPAVGFAIDLDAVALALDCAGAPLPLARRVLVTGGPEASRTVQRLRAAGLTAVEFPEAGRDPRAYADDWGYTHIATAAGGIVDLASGVERAIDAFLQDATSEHR